MGVRPVVACGALRTEISRALANLGRPASPVWLGPALHVDLPALEAALGAALARVGPGALVVYGDCHPRMASLLGRASADRTDGGNCLEMLLGAERYAAELLAGAFFLLGPWARSFEAVVLRSFGAGWEVTGPLVREHCRYVLAVRTPVSGDFREDAERVARRLGLPLRWADAGLEHLEAVLARGLEGGGT